MGLTRIRKAFFGLCLSLFLSANGFAVEKDISGPLSHYIMAVVQDNLGNLDEADKQYHAALKQDYESAVIHLSLAGLCIKNNDIPRAIEELKLAAEFNPEAIEPHALLAILYSSQNKPGLAVPEYEIALKKASGLEPANADIYKSLGLVYLQQKKFAEAQSAFELAVKLTPGDPAGHFYLANAYSELKNNASAEKELRVSIKLNPDYPEALNFLGYLCVEENKRLKEAEILIKKALEFEPDNGAYIDSLGWLYFKKGLLDQAIENLEKASGRIQDPVIYDHLGDAYSKAGDKSKAKRNWQRSLELDPAQSKVKNKIDGIL